MPVGLAAMREADAGEGMRKGEGIRREVVSVDVVDWAWMEGRRRDRSGSVRVRVSMVVVVAGGKCG